MKKKEAKPRDLIISVGIGEMKVALPPSCIRAVGIGSCVAVMVRDGCCGATGMAHVLLPWLPKRPREGANLFKYADYAIERMLDLILQSGGHRQNLGAKVVGGAHMFEGSKGSQLLDVGHRNLEAVRRKLKQLSIPVLAEDTGGNYGRSVEIFLESGLVQVRSVNGGDRTL